MHTTELLLFVDDYAILMYSQTVLSMPQFIINHNPTASLGQQQETKSKSLSLSYLPKIRVNYSSLCFVLQY